MRPVIGVEVLEVQDIDGRIRLNVSGVTPGSAADEAGLRIGDIITRWDDFPIHTKSDFARAVQDAHIGSTALLQVERRSPTGLGGFNTAVLDILRLTIRGVPI
jgi:putative serine protease PepD